MFEKIFTDLAQECDLQDVSIDSTIVKAHKDAGYSNVIVTTNLPSGSSPLFIVLLFFFGYSDLFNTT